MTTQLPQSLYQQGLKAFKDALAFKASQKNGKGIIFMKYLKYERVQTPKTS